MIVYEYMTKLVDAQASKVPLKVKIVMPLNHSWRYLKTKYLTSTPTFGFPPRIISVPLPAIFVDMVVAYFLPAWATNSASLAAYCKIFKYIA